MRVLFASHTSVLGGGERSLLELLGALPGEVSATLACPEGPLAEAARSRGVRVIAIAGTAGSLRLHPWHTAKALVELGRMALALRRLGRETQADLIHANSIRAGIAAVIAGWLGGPPAVVHVRDCLPPGRVTALVRRLIGGRAALVVANSRYSAARFSANGVRAPVRVAHSPVDLERFDPERFDRAEARAQLDLDSEIPLLGVVAQITPWKGQHTAISALAALRESVPGAMLLIVGEAKFVAASTRHDNRAYLAQLHELVDELELEDAVRFLGEREDVPEVLCALDLLLVPSAEEPFGRSAVEGMAMGLPVLATEVGGVAEVIENGKTGHLLPPDDPQAWARAAGELLADAGGRAAMGAAARSAAFRFRPEVHAAEIRDAYNCVR